MVSFSALNSNIQPSSSTIFIFVCNFFFSKNIKIKLFGHPLNPRALGTPPWVQERQILFRIALTRALYDQMAPQLCPFYVPGKLSFSFLVFIFIFSAFLMSGKHLPEERKTPIGPIHIVFLLGPTQTSFSFPPAGTPEATSWEQEQMARPQIVARLVQTGLAGPSQTAWLKKI